MVINLGTTEFCRAQNRKPNETDNEKWKNYKVGQYQLFQNLSIYHLCCVVVYNSYLQLYGHFKRPQRREVLLNRGYIDQFPQFWPCISNYRIDHFLSQFKKEPKQLHSPSFTCFIRGPLQLTVRLVRLLCLIYLSFPSRLGGLLCKAKNYEIVLSSFNAFSCLQDYLFLIRFSPPLPQNSDTWKGKSRPSSQADSSGGRIFLLKVKSEKTL